ncbi:MAG: hypothetical protein WC718_09390 [Phycisphaerales bacterium]
MTCGTITTHAKLLLVMAACALGVARASAQTGATPPEPTKPASAAPAQPDPTLDELLGLSRDPARPDAGDAGRAELDRKLNTTPEDPDPFAQAVGLMHQTTDRLAAASDPGAQTQRLQTQVLEKLDRLIAEAQKNKNSKNKSKSKPKPNEGDSKPQSKQGSQATPAPSNQAGDPSVPRQDGELRPPPPSAAASWGELPQRERDLLTQGLSDKFSSVYRQLTEQYYKRLAEQPAGGPR